MFSALALLLLPASAQVSSSAGAIRGVVLDPSGSPVAGASVTLLNPTLSVRRQAITQPDGTYVFPLLQPAEAYQVAVEHPGFARALWKDLQVRVTETTVADTTLAVGTVTQELLVSAETQAVETTSATLGGVVSTAVFAALPLPTRNVFDLMATDAGVASALTSPSSTIIQGSNAIYVGGARATSNNYTLNGVDANNFEFQTLAAGVVPLPNPDAVQEFRTQTSLYDATSGYNAGGNLTVVTRAGTRDYHGAAYEFFRNTRLNAADYFANASGQAKPVMQQNQFGGSLGGRLPRSGGTFFFFNYEAVRQKNGVAGSVSGFQPVLPATRDAASLANAFGLPVSSIDPVAVNLLNAKGSYNGLLIPSGTGAPVGTMGTFRYSTPVIYDSGQYSGRLDREVKLLGRSSHLAATYFSSSSDFTNPSGASGSLGQPYGYPLGSRNATLSDTHIVSSNLINDLVGGFTWNQRDIEATGGLALADVGMTRSNNSVTSLLPNLTFLNQLGCCGYAANVQHPQRTVTYTLRDTLSWNKGRHSLRFGFETRREEFNDGIYLPRGSLGFQTGIANSIYGNSPLGAAGNLAFRDFLIGAPTTISFLSGLTTMNFRARDYLAFLQDDFRLTHRLTLNAGLRYDHLGNPTETHNTITNFDPSLLSQDTLLHGGPGLADGFVTAGKNGVSTSTMLDPNYGSISPRFGLAYDILGTGKLALRGGYGIYYQNTNYSLQYANSGNPPYQISTATTNTTATHLLANPFPSLPLPNQFPVYPTFPTLTGVSASGVPVYDRPQLSVQAVDRHLRAPYSQNWSLNIQGEFLPNWTLEIGYLGSHALRQQASLQLNNALMVNSANPGRFGLTTNSSANRDARVPIAGLGVGGLSVIKNIASANYNALLATVNHRFAKRFLFKAAYTFSKSIDNFQSDAGSNYQGSAVGNPYDLNLNRGISEQNIPNRLVVTSVWDIPGFKRGLLGAVLGNWSLAGIFTYQNGFPGVVTQSIGTTSLTGSSGYGVITPGCNLQSSGRVQDHLNNYLNVACVQTTPLLAGGTAFGPYSPYLTAGSGTYNITAGGSGRLLGTSTRGAFTAPFQQREDLTLSKKFPVRALGEAGAIELRAEAFKVLNNSIFSAPSAAAGSTTFGIITSTIDNTGRQIQLALKLNF